MRPATTRRRSPVRRRFGGLGAGALAVVAATAALGLAAFAFGWPPFAAPEAGFQQPADTVAVPIAPRTLPPYQRIALPDLIDESTGRPSYVFLAPESVREEMLTDLTQIVGRILGREKSAGMAFTERDFAPRGTTPGIAGGVPPGKRALRVDISDVSGLEELRPGDRFDLVATLPLEASQLGSESFGGIRTADAIALDPSFANWTKQATVEVIVQNGVLVEPVKTRTMPISVSTLTQGQITRTRPVQEVVVALAPNEVAPLVQAIAIEAEIRSVIRSGHPDDPIDSVTPGGELRSPLDRVDSRDQAGPGFRMVEAIDGDGRRFVAVREDAIRQRAEDGGAEGTGSSPAAGVAGARPSLPPVGAPPPGWTGGEPR